MKDGERKLTDQSIKNLHIFQKIGKRKLKEFIGRKNLLANAQEEKLKDR